MEPGKWKQALGGLLQKEKAVKLVVLLGICGIALIGLSSFWEPSGQQDAPAESSVPAADYREELEESLCRIVTAITGEAQPTVVVTLSDNGRSLYAADERESGRQEESASSQERETSPILLEDAQGNQHALTVTQTQPEVQGVVVVSNFAGGPRRAGETPHSGVHGPGSLLGAGVRHQPGLNKQNIQEGFVMKFGKKQLVLASLVLALGAAVYLNWQFAGTGRLPVGDSSSETSQLGAAQLVNNTYVETVNDVAESGEASGDALAQARMDRQNSRDQALELLDGVLEDVDSDSAAKQQAVEEASAIAQNILAESNVESLLEAKGYTDCVAYITAQECSVVLAGAVEEADTLIVQEVVMEQTGLTADKIKIIGTN